jgi:hypothetical protein
MFRSIFARIARKAMVGEVILGVGMTFVVSSAAAQIGGTRQVVLSPNTQLVLNRILGSTTPYGRQLVWNALAKIGPERAESQLAPLIAVSPAELQARLYVIGLIMQNLPAGYHQAFMNGLFQASQEEEQLANQIINQFAQSLNAQGGGPSNADWLYAQRWSRMLTWQTFLNRP